MSSEISLQPEEWLIFGMIDNPARIRRSLKTHESRLMRSIIELDLG
jgi:hypothetical protein